MLDFIVVTIQRNHKQNTNRTQTEHKQNTNRYQFYTRPI